VGFVKILRDRTAQRRSEDDLREERAALAIINRAASALARETEPQGLAQIVTDAGVELSGAQFGAFFYNVTNAAGESCMLHTLSGAHAEAFCAFSMSRDATLFEPTFSGHEVVRCDDIAADPRHGRSLLSSAMAEGDLPVRSVLAVPVMSRAGAVLGGLFFGHRTPAVFTERSEDRVRALAAEAAVALDNARLSREREQELVERRRAEDALRELNATLEQQVRERTEQLERNAEALRQSQKMEAIGQLTGGLAHDFNNLLQTIVVNLDLIRRVAPPDDGRVQRAVNSAMNGALRAASLTQRLLAFARRQPLSPKPIDGNALVQGMSELLHRTLGETVAVETVLGAGLWRIEVDPNELESAILNLAVNARDAMPDGGKLTIETANAHLDEVYTRDHAEVSAGQYVLFAISDTGVGMNEATLQRAFEPFFTTKPTGMGTGLGLSQVYGFVKQSGGHVKIYSEPGLGTTIKLYLPRFHGSGDTALPSRPSDHAVPGAAGRETVLVVEDDDDVRESTIESLRELGYRTLSARDGPAAIRLVERHPEINLLLTDVVLPGGMTGAQVAAAARPLIRGLRVLYTTGYARNAIVHHGRLDPGVHLLSKPFTFDELADKVRDVLDEPAGDG
jgi:signal transduction histidine kinase